VTESLFQFHHGSIQDSLISWRTHVVSRVSIPSWFDSRPNESASTSLLMTGFNSIMVRFKTFSARSVRRRIPWFQFHHGSIQDPLLLDPQIAAYGVSIPSWFDSRPSTC